MTIFAILPRNSLLCAALGFNEKQRLRKKQSFFMVLFTFLFIQLLFLKMVFKTLT